MAILYSIMTTLSDSERWTVMVLRKQNLILTTYEVRGARTQDLISLRCTLNLLNA